MLAYLLERALVDPGSGAERARTARMSSPVRFHEARSEGWSAPWGSRDAELILRRLAGGETVERVAHALGLDPGLLRAVLRDLARRSFKSDRLAQIFHGLAEGHTVGLLAGDLDVGEEEISAELDPSDQLVSVVCAALMARTALPSPPRGYLGTSAQGPLRTMPVRFPDQQYQRLKGWCEENGFPMAVVVRGVVERFLDEQQRRGS